MRTLILYSTKSGASKECASLLAKQIEDCAVHNLSRTVPELSSFETIIIGSGIRMGKLYKPVRTFVKTHEDLLLTKRLAFYLCNAYPDTLQKAIENNIPKTLAQSAVCIKSFGGKQPFSNTNNFDWMIAENIVALAQRVLDET